MKQSVSNALGEYAAGLTFDDVPGAVRDHAKLLVLDTLMCGILGSSSGEVEVLTRLVPKMESAGPAVTWVTDVSASPPTVSMVNATAVHAFELDDIAIGQHYGASVLPPILALTDYGGPIITGEDLLLAMVTGAQVAARIQRAVGRSPHAVVGFHGPSVIATFAAAAAAAKALRLGATDTAHAIGHAAQQASGLMATQSGGMGKRLLAGVAARNGTFAALLATEGFTSADDMLERPYGGFFPAISGGADTWDAAAALTDADGYWALADTRMKFWACRFPIHPTLDGLRELRSDHGFSATDVERIDVALDPAAVKAVGSSWIPSSPASAQMNLRVCAASYLLDDDVFIHQFTPEALTRSALQDLIARIHVEELPAEGGLFKRESPVRVRLNNGMELSTIGRVRGGTADPDTTKLVELKANRIARVIGRDEAFVEALEWRKLDLVPDVRALLAWIRSAGGGNDGPGRGAG